MPASTLRRIEGLPIPAEVLVADDAAAVAEAAATHIAGWLTDALAVRPTAHLALTGGSSAGHLATELRKPHWRSAVPWDRVHLWWGDDRFVPADHPDSNFGAAFRDLLSDGGLPVPSQNVHPVPVDTAVADDRDAAWTAGVYRDEVLTFLPRGTAGALPAFDVILLGVGPDGHTLSVFPDSPALDPETPIVMAVPAPTTVDPKVARITLSPRLLAAAAHVLPMVSGAPKALIVKRILAGPRVVRELPAQLATGANATWLLDRGSAAELPVAGTTEG
jgi:6-phosphogluconolactonase